MRKKREAKKTREKGLAEKREKKKKGKRT